MYSLKFVSSLEILLFNSLPYLSNASNATNPFVNFFAFGKKFTILVGPAI